MKLAFLGTGAFAVPALQSLARCGHEISVAISQPDRPAGRGKRIMPTPLRTAAEALGIRHIQTADVNALDFADTFGLSEIGVVAAFGQKIGGAILEGLPRGCLNIHGSLLPKYRGAAPFQRAIIAGEQHTGVTVFQLDTRWDAGPIWGMRETAIGDTETADELHDRLALLGAELIVATLPEIESRARQPTTQDLSAATKAPKLSKAEGCVSWTEPAERVVRRINGLWSWPGAACLFAAHSGRRERVTLARAECAERDSTPTDDMPPGAVRNDHAVQTGRGSVRVLEIKPAGSKLMTFEAFSNGRGVRIPDRFLPLEES